MQEHHEHQKRFYQHLCKHPNAHLAAKSFAKKIAAKDPQAVAALKELAANAKTDEKAANALRIIAVTFKFEPPTTGTMIAGGIPAEAGHVVLKTLKFALSPAAWALSSAGKVFHWSGQQLQHLSHAI